VTQGRWDTCVSHRGAGTAEFIKTFFDDPKRRCCLVAGAGFDPRTTACAEVLALALQSRLRGVFIREERRGANQHVVAIADANLRRLQNLVPDSVVEDVEIFSADDAVVGGRNAVAQIAARSFDGLTDVFVDLSALSIGTSFPVVQYLLRLAESRDAFNLHVVVTSGPQEEEGRKRVSNSISTIVHGFHGQLRLHSASQSAKLWMPQLSIAKREALNVIFRSERFDDVCPILPFPSQNPRKADAMAEAFIKEIEKTWSVDAHNLVYAAEDDPLDVYRSILEIERLRRPVFEKIGSVVVLSPVGSKVVAVGALMAALERLLPVVYVEALEYVLPPGVVPRNDSGELIHVWLHGEAYPPRSREAA
jgi:hypothetical protein